MTTMERATQRVAPTEGNMGFNPEVHHRRSIRLRDYDYARAEAYFVTFCAFQRAGLFGEVVDGKVWLNDAGRIVECRGGGYPSGL